MADRRLCARRGRVGAGVQHRRPAVRGAAALYENRQYAHAGLCRAPLEAALNAELAAAAAIDKARRGV